MIQSTIYRYVVFPLHFSTCVPTLVKQIMDVTYVNTIKFNSRDKKNAIENINITNYQPVCSMRSVYCGFQSLFRKDLIKKCCILRLNSYTWKETYTKLVSVFWTQTDILKVDNCLEQSVQQRNIKYVCLSLKYLLYNAPYDFIFTSRVTFTYTISCYWTNYSNQAYSG